MKILNIGSLNYDYTYSVHHILKGGETIASTKMETFCGGKGLNQSVALSRAGANVYHAGLVGNDGDLLLKTCLDNNIDITYIKKINDKSGHTIIQVDEEGQNCILLYGGSNRNLTMEYIDTVIKAFDPGDWLLLQNEVNLLDYIIKKAAERGLKIALNPSPYNKAIEACDLTKISLFLLNEIEGEQITGKSEVNDILDSLMQQYPEAKILLTLGSKGVVYRDKNQEASHGIYRVNVVDTTAAGDTFTGYFMNAIIQNVPMKEALEMASKASAIAVSRPGATSSIPFRNEVIDVKLELRESY